MIIINISNPQLFIESDTNAIEVQLQQPAIDVKLEGSVNFYQGIAYSFAAPFITNGTAISMPAADATHDGYLTDEDWNVFANKIGGSLSNNFIPVATGVSSLVDGYLFQDPNGIRITDNKIFSSADGASTMDFGNGLYFEAKGTHSTGYTAHIDADYIDILNQQGEFFADSTMMSMQHTAGLFRATVSGITNNTRGIQMNNSLMYFYHGTKLDFDSPTYNFNQATALAVHYIDASHNMVASYMDQTSNGIHFAAGKGIVNASNKRVYDSNANIFYHGTTGLKKIDVDNGQLFNVSQEKLSIDWNLRHGVWTDGTTVVYDWSNASGHLVLPYATASTIAGFDSTKGIISLDTATYPSLTELSYVKGGTSPFQTQINSKEATIAAGTTAQYWRGDKTWQTIDTSVVPENGDLYFTTARTLATALSGLNITGSSISATDTILQAFGKIQNQINGVLGGAVYHGTYNATTNSPALVDGTGTAGWYYVVNVSGNQNFGSGIINFNVGDWAIYNGTIWQKVDNTDAVSDVNGAIGSISLTGTANRITVSGNVWDIAATYVGQTSITTLGTIGTGVWHGTAIDYSYLNVNNSIVSGDIVSILWSKITSTPTTLAGYGITDALKNTNNLSDVSNAGTARTNLGVAIGSNVQAWDTELDSIAALGVSQGDLIFASGTNAYSKLAKNTTASRYLSNSGSSNNPAWAQVDLTNGVTGLLPVANMGTMTSVQLAALITDETGSGLNVFNNAPALTAPVITGGNSRMDIYSPQGFLINGKIVPTVASNNLTLTLQTLAGTNPSATDPVYVRIGDTVRSITAALSVTINSGASTFNSGAAELATKEIDYFIYLGYNATDGVVIGASRIPFATKYGDFSTTATNEKYCAISTITHAASTDYYEVIGRFAATLSAGAGYTWTVPTFTAINLIQRPIYETRNLIWTPTYTRVTTPYTNVPTNQVANYQVSYDMVFFLDQHTQNATVGGSGNQLMTLPFSTSQIGMVLCINSSSGSLQQGFVVSGSNSLKLIPSEATASNVYIVNGWIHI